jgi:hypothetical protein
VGQPTWKYSAAVLACAGALTIVPGCGDDELAPVAPATDPTARLTAIVQGCTHHVGNQNARDCMREEVERAVDSGELPESYRGGNAFVILPEHVSGKIEMRPVKKGRNPAP